MNYSQITLYVPTGALEAYAADPAWNVFGAIVEEEYSGVGVAAADTHSADKEIYTLGGVRLKQSFPELPSGIYVVRDKHTSTKIYKR